MDNNPDIIVVEPKQVSRFSIAHIINERFSDQHCLQIDVPIDAVALAKRYCPSVIILDITTPGIDIVALREEIQSNCPSINIILVETKNNDGATCLDALERGVAECLVKPPPEKTEDYTSFCRMLGNLVYVLTRNSYTSPQIAATEHSHIRLTPGSNPVRTHQATSTGAIAIGASTGGPQAVIEVLRGLQGNLVNIPIFITVHMPAHFTKIYAGHLSEASQRACHEAQDGMIIDAGHIYLAPGDFHMTVEPAEEGEVIKLLHTPPENHCRPAVDPMLRSLIAIYGKKLTVVILTGMGKDGLEGCRQVVEAGGRIIAQDKKTSVVWGMPGAVAEADICEAILPLADIAPYLTGA